MGGNSNIGAAHAVAALRTQLLSVLPSASVPTGIYYLPTASSPNIALADGTPAAPALNKLGWRETIFALKQSAANGISVPEPDETDAIAAQYLAKGLNPIAISHFDYHTPESGYMERITAAVSEGAAVPPPELGTQGQGIAQQTSFAAGPLLKHGYELFFPKPPVQYGLASRWIIPHDLYFSNAGEAAEFQVDAGDGQGFKSVRLDQPFDVAYKSAGTQTMHVRAQVSGKTLEAAFTVDVEASSAPTPNEYWDLTAPDGFNNATGHAWVFYGNGHAGIVNPLIVSEGFPGGYSLDQLWAIFDEQNFATNLLAGGYDVIILGYADGTTNVEYNAGVAIAAITKTISERSGNVPLIVGGASMGGLITRYALAYMETNGLAADTALYFSFDSPHIGAVVPASIMYFLSYFASQSDFIKLANDAITSTAAQEMLVYSLPRYSEDMAVPSGLRTAFLQNFAGVGNWPKTPRKIGVSNGDGTGVGNGTPPNAEGLQWSAYLGSVGAKLYTAAGVTDRSNTNVVAGLTWGWSTDFSWTENSTQFDGAPGGTSPFFQLIARGLQAAGYTNYTCYYDTATFMPAITGCALSQLNPLNQTDLYTDISTTTSPSDLDAYTCSQENDPHVTITPYLAQWLLNELAGSVARG